MVIVPRSLDSNNHPCFFKYFSLQYSYPSHVNLTEKEVSNLRNLQKQQYLAEWFFILFSFCKVKMCNIKYSIIHWLSIIIGRLLPWLGWNIFGNSGGVRFSRFNKSTLYSGNLSTGTHWLIFRNDTHYKAWTWWTAHYGLDKINRYNIMLNCKQLKHNQLMTWLFFNCKNTE